MDDPAPVPVPAAAIEQPFDRRIAHLERVLTRWTERPSTSIACGSWGDGALAEIVHAGAGRLLPAAYDGCFLGVRELRFDGVDHHIHVDLGRVHTASYAIAPSVCFGGAPSLEVRFLTTGAGGAPTARWSLSAMVTRPYDGATLHADELRWFLDAAVTDLAAGPDATRFDIDPEVRRGPHGEQLRVATAAALGLAAATDWPALASRIEAMAAPGASAEVTPVVGELLAEALALPDAAVVVLRDRLLVELQTERLDGVHRYEEAGHVSWQIGATEDHHCHLALASVTAVQFCAEPSPCQGGRLNYTLWFLVPGDSGNPFRTDGYFSIVLNRPHDGDRARREVIDPMLDLYLRHRHHPWVGADEAFAAAAAHRTTGRSRDRPADTHHRRFGG
ncbi:MAG: hypothetical protein R2755_18975 [Acidimicrobiales bacterium]